MNTRTATPARQLTSSQAATVRDAQAALAASVAETDTDSFPRHLGRLEVALEGALAIIASLTGQ